MRIKLLILALAMTIQLAAAQHLRLHSATDGVTVLSGGKKTAATAGMTLKPVDALLIPEGAAPVGHEPDRQPRQQAQPVEKHVGLRQAHIQGAGGGEPLALRL